MVRGTKGWQLSTLALDYATVSGSHCKILLKAVRNVIAISRLLTPNNACYTSCPQVVRVASMYMH